MQAVLFSRSHIDCGRVEQDCLRSLCSRLLHWLLLRLQHSIAVLVGMRDNDHAIPRNAVSTCILASIIGVFLRHPVVSSVY